MSNTCISFGRLCFHYSRSLVNPFNVRHPLHQALKNSCSASVVSSSPRLLTRSYAGTPQPEVSPSDFDKICLVKAKIYANEEDIPRTVSYSQLKRARDYMRIRVASWMMVFTVIGSGFMIMWGRSDRNSGKTATKMGQAQFDEWRKQGLKEEQQRHENPSTGSQ